MVDKGQWTMKYTQRNLKPGPTFRIFGVHDKNGLTIIDELAFNKFLDRLEVSELKEKSKETQEVQ